jgi:hypothetical protein
MVVVVVVAVFDVANQIDHKVCRSCLVILVNNTVVCCIVVALVVKIV